MCSENIMKIGTMDRGDVLECDLDNRSIYTYPREERREKSAFE